MESEKQCTTCKCIKSIENFAFRNKINGTYQSQCNCCRRKTAKKCYENNKQSHIARSCRNNKKQQNKFNNWKKQQSCSVCGEEDYICLDFHHINDKEKDFNISGMSGKVGIKTIIKELKKCICVCSNCHRKIHAKRINASVVKLDITQLYES